ncbi:MAG TPA: hypothetical protein VGT08_08680 [Terracidiphilus sp.]|nr:hypothetical protein [Terracidiphilus sp.]
MALGIDHHVHYRCQFTLVPQHGADTKWADVPYAIRRWIGNRAEQNQGFQGKWYFVGGQWKPAGDKRFSVQTARYIGNGSDDAPQYWAVRYEHADDSTAARQWCTDIGLTLMPTGEIIFSLLTTHWLQAGFIGKEPEPPLPTAPGIVSLLLRDRSWRSVGGTELLTSQPKVVNEGHADEFRDRLFDQQRDVPIVLVSKNFYTGKPMLDAVHLSKLLAGSATVYESSTSLVDKELEYLLESGYRCWNGMVRVYQTGLNPERYGDSRRHRYFTADDIATYGESAIMEFLVKGIVRRSQRTSNIAVANVEDVQARIQEGHLASLRASAPGTEAWIQALEADNKRLSDELVESKRETQMWIDEAERLQTVEEDNRVLEFRVAKHINERDIAVSDVDLLRRQGQGLLNLDKFPESVDAVIGLVEATFPDRIIFTERAKSDARDSKLRDVNAAWRCLRSMATHLHRLHFEEKLPLREVAKQYQNLVPFELATTESETTKNNKKLARQRKAVYKGIERDFSPHVKVGRDPANSLRVHYFADNEAQLIVVDRCGNHLDLKSTN